MAKDPHLWEREMLVKMDDAVAGEMYVPGVTIKPSKTPGRLGPVATPGQHTDEVPRAVLGYDGATIDALRCDGAVKWERAGDRYRGERSPLPPICN